MRLGALACSRTRVPVPTTPLFDAVWPIGPAGNVTSYAQIADFTNGVGPPFPAVYVQAADRLQLVSSNPTPRQGSYSLRMECRPGDRPVTAGSERTEITSWGTTPYGSRWWLPGNPGPGSKGADVWVAFSILFDPTFEAPPTGKWEIFMQLKGGVGGSPNFSLELSGNHPMSSEGFQIGVRGGDYGTGLAYPYQTYYYTNSPVQRGVWYDFLIHTIRDLVERAPLTGVTGIASSPPPADTFTKTGHGLANAERITLSSLSGGAGLSIAPWAYWTVNVTATTFQLATTRGGSAVNFTTDVSAVTVTSGGGAGNALTDLWWREAGGSFQPSGSPFIHNTDANCYTYDGIPDGQAFLKLDIYRAAPTGKSQPNDIINWGCARVSDTRPGAESLWPS